MPALDELSVGFRNAYIDHAALTAQLRAWSDAYPGLCHLDSLGTTPEGREIWIASIGPQPERVRPAAWVDGNMHAVELAGSSVALAIAEDALRLHVEGTTELPAPIADGWLGVYLSQDHDEPVITEVIPDSPAWNAGMKVGDVLLAVGDTATATRDEFIAAIRAGKVGDRLSIKLRRDGKEQTVVVKLGERPEQTAEGGAQPAKPAKPGKPKGSEPKGGKPSQPAVEPAQP